MRRIAYSVGVLFLFAFTHLTARAVTLQILTQDELTRKSTAIVYATVIDSYGALHGSMIYTHYRVQVKESWKGAQKITEVMLPGGVANGYRQTFAGVPSLMPGETYLMFLWAGPTGAPQLTGLTQGLFQVAPDSVGNLIASRPRTTEQLLDSSGNAVQDKAVSMQLSSLRTFVTSRLAGKVWK